MRNGLAPEDRVRANRAATDPPAVGEVFVASQLQFRPGVADTQAVLARELSSGSDDGARLFRQATTLNRDIERARIEAARLAQLPDSPEVGAQRADIGTQLDNLTFPQSEKIVQLSGFQIRQAQCRVRGGQYE